MKKKLLWTLVGGAIFILGVLPAIFSNNEKSQHNLVDLPSEVVTIYPSATLPTSTPFPTKITLQPSATFTKIPSSTPYRIPTLVPPTIAVTGCPQGCTTQIANCNIKGNISVDDGEKIYHLPGMKYYDKTKISPEYGERWFCTEEEANANGWRKAKT